MQASGVRGVALGDLVGEGGSTTRVFDPPGACRASLSKTG
jgi:hypothetical protein